MIRELVYILVHFNINHATAQEDKKSTQHKRIVVDSIIFSHFLSYDTINGNIRFAFQKIGMTAYLSKHSFPRKKQQGNISLHLRGIDFL